jgi:uncharacterized protein YtpQ (UPF0354 family)
MIVPVIKSKGWLWEMAFQLSPESSMVSDDLVDDLVICYAFDLPDHFRFVKEDDRAALGLDPGGLRKLSVRNLTRLRGKPEILRPSWPGVMLRLDNNLEASLLLVDQLWRQLAGGIAGELIVAVPCRDILAVSGTGISGGIETLRGAVKRMWEKPENDPLLLLTRSLLVRRGDSWQVFTE